MSQFILILVLMQNSVQVQFLPSSDALIPAESAKSIRLDIRKQIPEAPIEGKQIVPVNKIPANVLSGAQAWLDRIFKQTVLAPKLISDGFGVRSSIHKDLIAARYSHGSVYLQVVETGRNTMLFIKDPTYPLHPSNPDQLIITVKAQIAKFCNVEESYLKTATAYHGLLSDKVTYGGQLAVPGPGVPELEIEWWNRPRFYVVGDVLILSFEERSGKVPTDRGAAGPPVLIPGTPRSPGRFGLIKS